MKHARHAGDNAGLFTQPMLSRVRTPVTSLLQTPLAQTLVTPLVWPRRIDDFLELVDPCWSLTQVRARVIDVQHEADDVTSLWLEPNDNWRGHRAGQHVMLTVTVDGVKQTRAFSVSNAPNSDNALRLTIKAHAKGHVSRWVNQRARVGDVVTLSAAQGQFLLPNDVLPSQLLFISGGSGVTPLIAMAQALVAAGYPGKLTWLHYELDAVPLEQEMQALVARLSNATLTILRTAPGPTSRAEAAPLLSETQLSQRVPAWSSHEAFVCGPAGMMKTVQTMYARANVASQFHSEHFQAERQVAAVSEPDARRRLHFARSGQDADARSGESLLEQAERAGLHPEYGCRMGICHTCTCKKISGRVRNQITGVVSDARDEEIQLCIHTPLSDVSLDL